jgi:hypothetical protein
MLEAGMKQKLELAVWVSGSAFLMLRIPFYGIILR